MSLPDHCGDDNAVQERDEVCVYSLIIVGTKNVRWDSGCEIAAKLLMICTTYSTK